MVTTWKLPSYRSIFGVKYEVIVSCLPEGTETRTNHNTRQIIISSSLDLCAQVYALSRAVAKSHALLPVVGDVQ